MPNFKIELSLNKGGEIHLEVTRGQDTNVECEPFPIKMTNDQITFYFSLKRDDMFIAFNAAKVTGMSLLQTPNVRKHLGLS